MDTEFHYWMTGCIARRSGFSVEEARTIAHACELVDRNDVSLEIESRSGGATYVNPISQTLNILKPRRELMRIYPIFHFVPGNPESPSAWRRDGRMHRLNTTPGGPVVTELLTEAFRAPEETRLHRIGIASHAFEDSWAHQNFVGWYDPFNHLGLDPKPNIGHADAEHHPDWMNHHWLDERLLEPQVSNRERFLSAARMLFTRYTEGLRSLGRDAADEAEWPSLLAEIVRITGPTWSGSRMRHEEQRLRRYRDAMPWLEPFDERTWLDGAIVTEVRGLEDSHEDWRRAVILFRDRYFWREDVIPEQTRWLAFQEAVRDHERVAIRALEPVFRTMGVDLARA